MGGSRFGRLRRFATRANLMLGLYWAVLLVSLYSFAELAGDIYEGERIGYDITLLTWLAQLQHPLVTRLALWLDLVGGLYVTVPLVALVGGALWFVWPRSSIFFVLAAGGAGALNAAAKAFFARARPDLEEALSVATNYSFPSGHTMMGSAIALAVLFLVRQHAPAWQVPVAVLCLLYALMAGVARMYLQVHYPTDVLAAWALAAAWVLGVNVWYGRTRRRRRYKRQ